ncbi:hypothetical protein [Bacillus sp. V33-4]|nr:hypothetical protein [Bacillus sp. V33-4]
MHRTQIARTFVYVEHYWRSWTLTDVVTISIPLDKQFLLTRK